MNEKVILSDSPFTLQDLFQFRNGFIVPYEPRPFVELSFLDTEDKVPLEEKSRVLLRKWAKLDE